MRINSSAEIIHDEKRWTTANIFDLVVETEGRMTASQRIETDIVSHNIIFNEEEKQCTQEPTTEQQSQARTTVARNMQTLRSQAIVPDLRSDDLRFSLTFFLKFGNYFIVAVAGDFVFATFKNLNINLAAGEECDGFA